MSKDGDWILREDKEALGHVLATLQRRGARYRYGAPLERYQSAARAWAAEWPRLAKQLAGRPLSEAHERMVSRAAELLPGAP